MGEPTSIITQKQLPQVTKGHQSIRNVARMAFLRLISKLESALERFQIDQRFIIMLSLAKYLELICYTKDNYDGNLKLLRQILMFLDELEADEKKERTLRKCCRSWAEGRTTANGALFIDPLTIDVLLNEEALKAYLELFSENDFELIEPMFEDVKSFFSEQ